MKLSKEFLDFLDERVNKCNSVLPELLEKDPFDEETIFERQLYLKIIIAISLIRENRDQAVHYAEYYVQSDDPTFSRNLEIMKRPRLPSVHLGASLAIEDIDYGICYYLLDPNHPLFLAHFKWAADFSYPRDDEVQSRIAWERNGDEGGLEIVARSDSWHAYCLVIFGRFKEAIPFLNEVVPFFKTALRNGGVIMDWIEYHLPLALLPLCEYQCEPTEENRADAQKGMDDFIGKLNDFQNKRDAFRYAFLLKDLYPGVYAPPAKAKRSKKDKKRENPVFQHPFLPVDYPPENENLGGIIVEVSTVPRSNYVGKKSAFERLCKKIRDFDKYPVLGAANESFASQEILDPVPVIEECHAILNDQALNKEEEDSVRAILEIAMIAEELKSGVMFWFSEDWGEEL